jgi:hypothetical protein
MTCNLVLLLFGEAHIFLKRDRTVQLGKLKGYLGNWPHYYRVVRSKLMFYNVLTTSINTHIKRKNLKTICSSETISSRIFVSAPNSPNTRCHLCNLVSLRHCDLVIGECTVPARPSPFSSRQISWHVHLNALPRQCNGALLLNLGAR